VRDPDAFHLEVAVGRPELAELLLAHLLAETLLLSDLDITL
jgi:hypothetical protein